MNSDLPLTGIWTALVGVRGRAKALAMVVLVLVLGGLRVTDSLRLGRVGLDRLGMPAFEGLVTAGSSPCWFQGEEKKTVVGVVVEDVACVAEEDAEEEDALWRVYRWDREVSIMADGCCHVPGWASMYYEWVCDGAQPKTLASSFAGLCRKGCKGPVTAILGSLSIVCLTCRGRVLCISVIWGVFT